MNYKLQTFNIEMNVSRIANVHYFEFTDIYHTRNDSHNFYELLYVDKGEIEVHAENYSGKLSVNQLLIHRPNEVHSLSSGETAPNVIIIGFECKSDLLYPFSEQPITLSSEHSRMLARVLQEGMSLYEPPYDVPNQSFMKKRSNYPFGADQMVKICLESFLIALMRDYHTDHPPVPAANALPANAVQAIHQYITEHYTARITLDHLCFLFGTNKTSLCQNFRNTYGCTILNYINDLRIKEAKGMLRRGRLSITEISEQLGFDSVHYFCRLFKKKTGQSPTQYAKSIRARLAL